jgi:hypothetical protein
LEFPRILPPGDLVISNVGGKAGTIRRVALGAREELTKARAGLRPSTAGLVKATIDLAIERLAELAVDEQSGSTRFVKRVVLLTHHDLDYASDVMGTDVQSPVWNAIDRAKAKLEGLSFFVGPWTEEELRLSY